MVHIHVRCGATRILAKLQQLRIDRWVAQYDAQASSSDSAIHAPVAEMHCMHSVVALKRATEYPCNQSGAVRDRARSAARRPAPDRAPRTVGVARTPGAGEVLKVRVGGERGRGVELNGNRFKKSMSL